MNSVILYATTIPIPGIKYDKVHTDLGVLHIRHEIVSVSPLEALDDIDPKPGETVLNTIPIPLGWSDEDAELLASLGVAVPLQSGMYEKGT